MNRNFRVCRTLAAIVSLSIWALTSSVFADDHISLKQNVRAGTAWTFERADVWDVTTIQTPADSTASRTANRYTRQRIAGRVDVLESTDGAPTAMRISFDRDSGGKDTIGDETTTFTHPLAGLTFNVRIDPSRGELTCVDQALPDTTIIELRRFVLGDQGVLPDRAVAVGDTWKADTNLITRIAGLRTDQYRLDMTFKLIDQRTMGAKTFAEVTADSNLFGDPDGVQTDYKTQTRALIDVTTGQMVRFNSTTNIDVNAPKDRRGDANHDIYRDSYISKGTVTSYGSIEYVKPEPTTRHWCGTQG